MSLCTVLLCTIKPIYQLFLTEIRVLKTAFPIAIFGNSSSLHKKTFSKYSPHVLQRWRPAAHPKHISSLLVGTFSAPHHPSLGQPPHHIRTTMKTPQYSGSWLDNWRRCFSEPRSYADKAILVARDTFSKQCLGPHFSYLRYLALISSPHLHYSSANDRLEQSE